MSEHTPGPWRVHSEVPNRIILNGSACYEVVDLVRMEQYHNYADMRLIAAAPELLAALKDAVEFIRGSNECLGPANSSSDREWIDYCVALQESCEQAVAKAEGRGDAVD